MERFISRSVVVLFLAMTGVAYGYGCLCDGDLNGDTFVDDADLQMWQNCFIGMPGACAACAVPGCDVDCNGSALVADADAITCIEASGENPNPCCCAPPPDKQQGIPLPCECFTDSDCQSGESCVDNVCELVVPTVSQWGFSALALMVLSAGTIVIVTRRAHSLPQP